MRLPGRNAPSRRAALRAVACVVAMAAMLGQVAGYAHLAFTAHVRCAEHGELIEAGSSSGSAVTASLGSASPSHARIDTAGAAGHGHDHCAAAPHRRDRATHPFTHTFVATGQLGLVARITAQIGPPRAIDLLFVAPKSSPPAA
jgi:hypothetical protein